MRKEEARQFTLALMGAPPAVYLATVDAQGLPQIRAVNNLRHLGSYPSLRTFFQQLENPFATYLSTFSNSDKSRQISQNPNVAIYYCRPESFHGVMLSGSMEQVSDRAVKEALWQDQWVHFWPRGPADSRYRVFRFDPAGAKGWNGEERFAFKIR